MTTEPTVLHYTTDIQVTKNMQDSCCKIEKQGLPLLILKSYLSKKNFGQDGFSALVTLIRCGRLLIWSIAYHT